MKNDNSTINNSSLTNPNTKGATVTDDNVLIEKGNTILGLYTIESDAIVGGMGSVYRVHHTGWKVDLAMKQPKRELFQNDEQKEAFIRECDHWIKLGLHPHIVSCYYVREIGGIPSIFAEWMDGGSLKDAIKKKTLYEGDEKEVLERILDISIQFARGLHYAHEQGLIHQDVKPDNLLLTGDGKAKVLTAKIGDFGIAGARAMIADANTIASGSGTVVVKGNAYTPAYCSPEQKQGKELTRRTDIWSWAVSVLEMYLGDRPWLDGTVAGMACEEYFEMDMRVPMPEAMKDLFRHCFRMNEAERPHDFGVVEVELLKIYQAEMGKTYSRPELKAASLTADSLNNRALSYLDLGKPEEAERCWEEVLKMNPHNVICLYNQGLHLWKTAQIDDMEASHRLTSVLAKDVNYYYCLAKLYLARADAESAIECCTEGITKYGEMKELKQVQVEANEMMEKGLDGRCLNTLKGVPGLVACFSPDGKQILSGGYNGELELLDLTTGECIHTLKGHIKKVLSVCFTLDGKQVLSGSEDGELNLWDLVTGECIHNLKHEREFNSVCFSPDGKYALIETLPKKSEKNRTVELWNITTEKCIRTLLKYEDGVGSFCFSPDGKQVLSGTVSRGFIRKREPVKLWDVATGECICILKEQTSIENLICFSPDGKSALTGNKNNTMELWDLTTGECIRTLGNFMKYDRSGIERGVSSVCYSPDGKLALSVSEEKNVTDWKNNVILL